MSISDKDQEFMKEVSTYFKSTIDPETMPEGSIRETAIKFNLTRTKVQKILVTTGDYSNEQTRKIQLMRDQGLSVKDIAEELSVSQATVSASLPYTVSFHGTAEPSDHTKAVRGYRAYEKAQVESMKNREEERQDMPSLSNKKKEKPTISRKKGEFLLPPNLIRLHIELDWVDDEEEVKILREYGGVKRGRTITRDIIVQKKIPLRSLHYVLQRAFGFQESHLHRFELFRDDLVALTENKMENFLNLRGVIFTEDRDGYEPVYEGGSFKKWLRRQYTEPFDYYSDWPPELQSERFSSPDEEFYLLTDKEGVKLQAVPAVMIDELDGHEKNQVKWEGWGRKLVFCDEGDPTAMSFEKVRLGDLNLEIGIRAMRGNPTNVIERLPVGDVLALAGDYLPFDENGKQIHSVIGLKKPQVVTKEGIREALEKGKQIYPKPFTDMLVYIYDYGDNWHFRITGSKGCSDLVEDGVITKKDLEKSIEKALRERHPVLIARDGDMLIEDSGNVQGFVDFLERVNLKEDSVIEQRDDYLDPDAFDGGWEPEEEGSIDWGDDDTEDENGMTRSELLNWALSQGWHRNDTSDINLL